MLIFNSRMVTQLMEIYTIFAMKLHPFDHRYHVVSIRWQPANQIPQQEIWKNSLIIFPSVWQIANDRSTTW